MMRFVGVGPGDPELITLKAVRAIEASDLIAVPDHDRGDSAVLRIAAEWIKGKPILRLAMPMQGEKADWREAHRQAAQTLLTQLGQGKHIAYLVLGDPSLYATSGYLLRLVSPHHPCEVAAGIPAVCEMAARLRIPLAEGRAPLHIQPGYVPGAPLPEGNVVIMKAGRSLQAVRSSLEGRQAYLVQNLGMPGERTGRLQDFSDEDFAERQSYFSTVFVPESDPY